MSKLHVITLHSSGLSPAVLLNFRTLYYDPNGLIWLKTKKGPNERKEHGLLNKEPKKLSRKAKGKKRVCWLKQKDKNIW